jgi:glycosyltransferase involved in cell wall biosynthesis
LTAATPTLRIAHVVLSLDVGGLERLVLALIQAGGRTARGQDVSVVCLERPGQLAVEAEAAGAKVWCIDKRPGLRFGTVGRLRTLFEQIAPDVVHSHQIGALLYAGPAARRAGVPVVIHTEHGNHLKRLTSWLARFKAKLLFRRASKRADAFCCVSKEIADTVIAIGVDPRKVAVVPNGIDTEVVVEPAEVDELRTRLAIPAGSVVIGTVGRLAEVKRQDRLIRAFAKLKKERPDAFLLLVGDGELRGELEGLANSLGVADSVRFAGYQPRPEACLRLMNVFALTSRSEGMPVSILEAWTAERPVVATRVGGVPDLVKHEENGLLIAEADEDGLVIGLKRLLENREEAALFAQRGQTLVRERYSLTRMAADYESRYAEVLRSVSP